MITHATMGSDRQTRRALLACAALVLGLAGCETSYRNAIEGGHRYDWESNATPAEVARCVTARVKAHKPWSVTQRPLDERGAIELVIGTGAERVTAVAHVTPWRYGSRIQGWVTSYAVLTRDVLHEQFFGGC